MIGEERAPHIFGVASPDITGSREDGSLPSGKPHVDIVPLRRALGHLNEQYVLAWEHACKALQRERRKPVRSREKTARLF